MTKLVDKAIEPFIKEMQETYEAALVMNDTNTMEVYERLLNLRNLDARIDEKGRLRLHSITLTSKQYMYLDWALTPSCVLDCKGVGEWYAKDMLLHDTDTSHEAESSILLLNSYELIKKDLDIYERRDANGSWFDRVSHARLRRNSQVYEETLVCQLSAEEFCHIMVASRGDFYVNYVNRWMNDRSYKALTIDPATGEHRHSFTLPKMIFLMGYYDFFSYYDVVLETLVQQADYRGTHEGYESTNYCVIDLYDTKDLRDALFNGVRIIRVGIEIFVSKTAKTKVTALNLYSIFYNYLEEYSTGRVVTNALKEKNISDALELARQYTLISEEAFLTRKTA